MVKNGHFKGKAKKNSLACESLQPRRENSFENVQWRVLWISRDKGTFIQSELENHVQKEDLCKKTTTATKFGEK